MELNTCTGLFQDLRVPEGWGSRISRQWALENGEFGSLKQRPLLLPRKYSWHSFVLEAESTPGSLWGRKDYANEKFQWSHRESKPRPCACPTLRQMWLNEISIDQISKRDTVDHSYCYFTNLLTIYLLQFSVRIGDQAPFCKIFKGEKLSHYKAVR